MGEKIQIHKHDDWDSQHTRLLFICSSASSEIGKPSCFSAIARLSQSCLQVEKRFYVKACSESLPSFSRYRKEVHTAGEKRCDISLLAYRLHNNYQFHLSKETTQRMPTSRAGSGTLQRLPSLLFVTVRKMRQESALSTHSLTLQVSTQDVDGSKEEVLISNVISNLCDRPIRSNQIVSPRYRAPSEFGFERHFPTRGDDLCPYLHRGVRRQPTKWMVNIWNVGIGR